MKLLVKIFLFCLITLNLPQKATAQVSYQVFYDSLSPYGYWINSSSYGYVWVPRVSESFIPYSTNGYWAYTNVGWVWVSDYSWGWAPFHYGRWYYDSYYGWVWVPDTVWGPGWVTWRSSPDYYGWAPIGPTGYRTPVTYWTFVGCNHFGQPNSSRYYMSNFYNPTIMNNTTIVTNTYRDPRQQVSFSKGPERAEVQKRTGTNVQTVAIASRTSPGQKIRGNTLEMYRPQLVDTGVRTAQPAQITDKKDIQPISIRDNTAGKRQTKINTVPKTTGPVKTAPQKSVSVPRNHPIQPHVKSSTPQHPILRQEPQRNNPPQKRELPQVQSQMQQPQQKNPQSPPVQQKLENIPHNIPVPQQRPVTPNGNKSDNGQRNN